MRSIKGWACIAKYVKITDQRALSKHNSNPFPFSNYLSVPTAVKSHT